MGSIVFESLLPVFLIIAVGLFLRKMEIIPHQQWRGVEALGYWLLFPALVMSSLIKMDITNIKLGSIALGYLLAVIVQMIVVWSLRKPLNRYLGINDKSFSSIFQTSTRWNAFIALAIADKIAGDQGLAIVALIMAVTVALLNFINIVALTVLTSDVKPTIKTTLVNTLKVPIIWGAIIGLVINLSQISIYQPILVSLDVIARAGLGIGLLTVGAGVSINAIQNTRSSVYIGVFAKLLVFPIFVYLSCLVFDIQGIALQMTMLCAGVSTAMNGYILAREMGADADLYAATASLQVIISMATLPLILWVLT